MRSNTEEIVTIVCFVALALLVTGALAHRLATEQIDTDGRLIEWSSDGEVTVRQDNARLVGPRNMTVASYVGPGWAPKLHLRGPHEPDGIHSQINLYEDAIGIWGGAPHGGNGLFLDQESLHPNEARALNLGTRERPFGVLAADAIVMPSMSSPGIRYACIDPDGVVFGSEGPCR